MNLYGYAHAPTRPPISREDFATWPGVVYSEGGVVPYEWTGDYVYAFGREAIDGWRRAVRYGVVSSYAGGSGDFDPLTGAIHWQVKQLMSCGTEAAAAAARAGTACLTGAIDARGIDLSLKLALEEGKKAGKVIAQAIAIAAPLIGVIPGIGQGVAMALTAASALALGKPLDEALIDIAANAVPGGALVKAAVTMAAGAARSLAAGDDVGDAGLAALRAGARAEGGDMAAAAFDAGVAIARGQALQEAGFQFVHKWFRGNDLADKAASFALKLAEAAANGVAVEDVLIEEAKDALARVAPEAARAGFDQAVRALVQNPEKYARSIEELAAELHVPIAVAQAAFMAVTEDDAGRVKPNEAMRRALFSYVDPSAQIQGEARNAAQLRAWTSAPVDYRGATFEEAREVYDPSVFAIRGEGAAAPVDDAEAPARPPRTTTTGDVVLVGVCALASAALVWFFARDGA